MGSPTQILHIFRSARTSCTTYDWSTRPVKSGHPCHPVVVVIVVAVVVVVDHVEGRPLANDRPSTLSP